MARDAYVDALGDNEMRLKILERDPITLEKALKIAIRLEALRRSLDRDEIWEDPGRRRERYAKVVTRSATNEWKINDLVEEFHKEQQQHQEEMAVLRRHHQN
jgi:hypothetical protein